MKEPFIIPFDKHPYKRARQFTPFSRRQKLEFAYKYRVEIVKLLWLGGPLRTKWISNLLNEERLRIMRYIAMRARTEIGYSTTSADCDITWAIIRHYRKLIY